MRASGTVVTIARAATLLLAAATGGCRKAEPCGTVAAGGAGRVPDVAAARAGTVLPGFERSPYFDEQVRTFIFDPEVAVHVNAPSVAVFDATRPTRLVIYALPNGNTIAQTIGCRSEPGLDWHYLIQHIGAQTRWVRAAQPDTNLVVAYAEAGGRSWPAWRRRHADSGARIVALVEALRALIPAAAGQRDCRAPGEAPREGPAITLSAHSGGGSLLFGYIEAVERIPDWIERIVWLDANYGYSNEAGHAEKLLEWLNRAPEHCLGVVAYDDREIELDGKKVVGPTGGTYRRTQEMIARFKELLALACDDRPDRTHCRALGGRLDIQLFRNPENRILHTVLVERNGFIHALTFGSPPPGLLPLPELLGDPAYQRWIQTGSSLAGHAGRNGP